MKLLDVMEWPVLTLNALWNSQRYKNSNVTILKKVYVMKLVE